MRPAATSRRQHPGPAPPVLADSPLSAKAFCKSVPKRLQKPAQRSSPGRNLQPRVLQTTGYQVGVDGVPLLHALPDTDTRAADRQVCRLSHAT